MTRIIVIDCHGDRHVRNLAEPWDLGWSIVHFVRTLHLDNNEIISISVL